MIYRSMNITQHKIQPPSTINPPIHIRRHLRISPNLCQTKQLTKRILLHVTRGIISKNLRFSFSFCSF
jgi:hypothetical protein